MADTATYNDTGIRIGIYSHFDDLGGSMRDALHQDPYFVTDSDDALRLFVRILVQLRIVSPFNQPNWRCRPVVVLRGVDLGVGNAAAAPERGTGADRGLRAHAMAILDFTTRLPTAHLHSMSTLDPRSLVAMAGFMALVMAVVLGFMRRYYPPGIHGLGY